LDLNQLDIMGYLLAPLLLDYQINGREANRSGNRSPVSCPQGVYPCSGDDDWCAITVSNDEEWHSFCRAMNLQELSHDLKFATFADRKANEDELDELIAVATVNYSSEELMYRLQKQGVPAGSVLNAKGIYCDPQLVHREHVWYMEHPEIGRSGYRTTPFKLSLTPAEPRRPAPCLGEHTFSVCSEIIGLDMDEFAQLLNEGVFE
jgi:benzylsuccinate CoA-transferase BbsF subunit